MARIPREPFCTNQLRCESLSSKEGIADFTGGLGSRSWTSAASRGALAGLKRLIQKLRQAYPKVLILFRADSGFAVPALYSYLEGQPGTRWVIGFIANRRLLTGTAPLLAKAQRQYQEAGEKQRLFTSFNYQAESWDQPP